MDVKSEIVAKEYYYMNISSDISILFIYIYLNLTAQNNIIYSPVLERVQKKTEREISRYTKSPLRGVFLAET